MTQPIKNELSWSFSRQQLFNRCQRAYFYHYYQSFGGWEYSAPLEAKQAYLLKNIISIDQWIGQVVHKTIEEILNNFKINREWLPFEKAKEIARDLLSRGWRQSTQRKWQQDIKNNLNLFEHYYKSEISQEKTEEIKEKVFTSIKEFLNSELPSSISTSDTPYWLKQQDRIPHFFWQGIKIWTNFDFGLEETHRNRILIYDFKTGKKENGDLQFLSYALYALEEKQYPLENISVNPVYLYPTFYCDKVQLTSQKIEGFKNYLQKSYKEMQRLHNEVYQNNASMEKFAKTKNQSICKYCVFREICT